MEKYLQFSVVFHPVRAIMEMRLYADIRRTSVVSSCFEFPVGRELDLVQSGSPEFSGEPDYFLCRGKLRFTFCFLHAHNNSATNNSPKEVSMIMKLDSTTAASLREVA
jgi:hypothetical protein